MPSRPNTIRNFAFIACALSPLLGLCAGCSHKTVQAAVPAPAPAPAPPRPMTIAPDTDATPPLEAQAEPPSIPTPSQDATVNLAPSRVTPPPRRPATSPAASEENNEAAARPQPPRIAPQLSPGDQASFQRRTVDDSNVANHNLQIVTGRQLNPTQQDLADKVRSFLAQSTDAGKDGDWTRAQNLAQKARVLSTELINSL